MEVTSTLRRVKIDDMSKKEITYINISIGTLVMFDSVETSFEACSCTTELDSKLSIVDMT